MLSILTSKKLKTIRMKANLTQVELGKRLGYGGSYITRLEKGALSPSLTFAFKLEHALHLRKGELSNLIIQATYQEAVGPADGFARVAISRDEAQDEKKEDASIAHIPLFMRAPRMFKGHSFKLTHAKGTYPVPAQFIKGEGVYLTMIESGEMLLIYGAGEPRNGDLVAMGPENGDIEIRRFYRAGKAIMLTTDDRRATQTPQMLPETAFWKVFRGVVAFKYLAPLR